MVVDEHRQSAIIMLGVYTVVAKNSKRQRCDDGEQSPSASGIPLSGSTSCHAGGESDAAPPASRVVAEDSESCRVEVPCPDTVSASLNSSPQGSHSQHVSDCTTCTDLCLTAPSALASQEVTERLRIVDALGHYLAKWTSLGNRPQQPTPFHCNFKTPPAMGIHDYIRRIATYYWCSNESLVVGGMVYVDRFVRCRPNFVLSRWSVHRLLAISIMVAAKFWDDVFYSNSHYARVCGLRTTELNSLELVFLKSIGWKLQVVPEDYDWFFAKLETAVAEAEGFASETCTAMNLVIHLHGLVFTND